MTTATATEVVCSECGDGLGEFSDTERTRVGRCCENLPGPWRMDPNTGTFTRSTDPETAARFHDGELDEEDLDTRRLPTCENCGSHRFLATATEWIQERQTCVIDAEEQDLSEGRPILYYDQHQFEPVENLDHEDFSITAVRCAECSAEYHGEFTDEDC